MMRTEVIKTSRASGNSSVIKIISSTRELEGCGYSARELKFIRKQLASKKTKIITVKSILPAHFIHFIEKKGESPELKEAYRLAGDNMLQRMKSFSVDKIYIDGLRADPELILAYCEGIVLGNYSFDKYKAKPDKYNIKLSEVRVKCRKLKDEDIEELKILTDATLAARDLVNEPLNYLNAEKLAEKIREMADDSGAKVEILNKKKLEALKMGGLLAVNKGSIDPPTFTIFEWKPEKPVNSKPVIFVGKGVVYDTGGLSLKPSNFMDTMKSDMAGAAAVAAAGYAIAKARLPVHIIVLVPATDNRPDGNAYVPGDIIKMFNGSTVEVLNTDAEGRMLLADALSYASKYDPMLVIDVATLTGSASRAIGKYGIVGMQTSARSAFNILQKSGDNVGERLVEFPLWDEFADMLKSDVADMNNIGGIDAGAITAGKFLEKFTSYPYIHLDIAGPSFVEKRYNYHGTGGTGVGVRLLYDFIRNKFNI